MQYIIVLWYMHFLGRLFVILWGKKHVIKYFMYIENILKCKIHFLVLIIVKLFVHISQVESTTKTVL